MVGGAVDLDRADTRDQAVSESEFVLGIDQHAIIAESEDWTSPIDTRMRAPGTGQTPTRTDALLPQLETGKIDSSVFPVIAGCRRARAYVNAEDAYLRGAPNQRR